MILRAALIIGLAIASGEALASEDSAARCVDASAPKAVVAAHHGRFIDLDVNQWQFLRGVYAMNPETPAGLPYGDRAVLARFDDRSDGIVFFIDGNRACTPMVAPSQLISMLTDIAAKTVKHEAAGL
jgi:hypothetical protein